MQYAFYYDQSRCMGCETCLVTCKDWNGVKPGPAQWRRITITEEGLFPSTSVFNLILSCNHCENPVCVEVCPTEAIYKRPEDGIVMVNRDICDASLDCVKQCPFGAPQFGDDLSEPVPDPNWTTAHPMQKCTFCWDRLAEGKKPACIEACPQRALDAGPLDELMAKYPDAIPTVVGLPDSTKNPEGITLPSGDTKPSILFKPKPADQPTVK